MDLLYCVAAGLGVGALAAGLTRPVLQALPEPSPDQMPNDETKVPYAALGTRSFVVATALGVTVAVIIVLLRAPAPTWPTWAGLTTLGVLLATIDARTTWLPLRLTRVLWVSTGVGLLLLPWLLASASQATLLSAAQRVIVAVGCALAYTVLFGLIWWIGRGALGFGDVRLAPVLGAVGGSVSWEVAVAGLLAGCLIGAVWALMLLAARRGGGFPYAPSLVLGPFVALLVLG